MDQRCSFGGIFEVLEILEDYKHAFTYDFRTRFGLGLEDLGEKVPWTEVISLVVILLSDPTSWLQAAKAKWQHPISYEWTIAASTYDLLAQVNSRRKPKPFPRPWANSDSVSKGSKPRRDAREILKKARDGELTWQNRPQKS